jgi:hypothetical protein
VVLLVKGGSATGRWTVRAVGKPSVAHLTISGDGTATAALDGWRLKDITPMAGAMSGRVAAEQIEVEGRWSNGVRVDGRWKRTR